MLQFIQKTLSIVSLLNSAFDSSRNRIRLSPKMFKNERKGRHSLYVIQLQVSSDFTIIIIFNRTIGKIFIFVSRIKGSGSDNNCLMSDVPSRDLRPGLDYIYDNDHLLFTWKELEPHCLMVDERPDIIGPASVPGRPFLYPDSGIPDPPPINYDRPDLRPRPPDYDRPGSGPPPPEIYRPGYGSPPSDYDRPVYGPPNQEKPIYGPPHKDHERPDYGYDYDNPSGHRRPYEYERPPSGYGKPPIDFERPTNHRRPLPFDYERPLPPDGNHIPDDSQIVVPLDPNKAQHDRPYPIGIGGHGAYGGGLIPDDKYNYGVGSHGNFDNKLGTFFRK